MRAENVKSSIQRTTTEKLTCTIPANGENTTACFRGEHGGTLSRIMLFLFLRLAIARLHPEVLFVVERANANYSLFPTYSTIQRHFKSNSNSNFPIFQFSLHNQHHFLSFPFPTFFMTRSNSKCLTIRRPFSTQRSSLDLQHDQSWNPSSVFKCPNVGIAVLRAGENAVVVRVPIQRSHGQVVLILTHQVSFLLRSMCATASNPRTEANCSFRR